MKWLQAFDRQISHYKYAINAKKLGDDAVLAWSNLGYWYEHATYSEACRALAQHLAESIQLNEYDRLLDLGCGQGASLVLWQQSYHVQNLEAVEWQESCVQKIQKSLQIAGIHQQSFLTLSEIEFPHPFDAVICIDAAYHSSLPFFLDEVCSILAKNGRLAFHYLMLSDQWLNLSYYQKQKYKWLLQAANIHLDDLKNEEEYRQILADKHFIHVEIQDLSQEVLGGFSEYVQQQLQHKKLDDIKIRMTAKLCEKLYLDGLVKYVQVSAQYTT